MMNIQTKSNTLNKTVDELISLFQKKEFNILIEKAKESIEEFPKSFELYNLIGLTFAEIKKRKEAIKYYKKALNVNPKNFVSDFYLGSIYHDNNDFSNAVKHYKKSINLNPEYVNAWFNLAVAYYDDNKPLEAIKSYKKIITLDPRHANTLYNLGYIHHELLNYNQSIIYYKLAIKLNPNFYDSYSNLAKVFMDKGDYKNSLKYYKLSLKKYPFDEKILNEIGVLFVNLNYYETALFFFKKALTVNPKSIKTKFNIASTLKDDGRYNQAKKLLNRIIKEQPKNFIAYLKQGEIFCNLGNFNQGIPYFLKAISLSKKNKNLYSKLFFFSNYSPDMSAEEIFAYYKQYDQRFGFPHKHKWKTFSQPKIPKNKLKIGYVSPDFQKHSVQNFLLPTLAHHNHKEFEIFAFAELEKEDKVSQEYKSYVDHWIRTDRMTDDELAQKIGDLGIDILVDLAGHTRNNRLTVFAQKPAPISVTWLGYGYTTGLSAIDYFLTDKFVTPKGSEHLFLEKPWQLKNHTYCCYKAQENMDKVTPLPALSNGFITFGTISKNLRINNNLISIWSIILKRVNKSKLLINNFDLNSHHSKEILISRFKAHGISENRLDFYYETPPWNSMHQIDIALDCFPHNSGTTLFEHLYMGNPFITYSSRPSVGKIGTSILSTLGHPEWIATSEEEYVDKAVTLASDPLKLSIIRQNLRTEMEASPLMDQKGFVRELEEAYQAMWKKWCST